MALILRRALIVLFLSAVFQTSACADTIYLKNGGKIKGRVVKDNAETVTINVDGGTVVQNKADIVRVKKDEGAILPKEPESGRLNEPETLNAAEEESATPMLDTNKKDKGPFGTVGRVVDTAFSIAKFDFLKKDK